MKTIRYIPWMMTALLVPGFLLAQVSVNINFSVPTGVRFVYLPSIETYYDVRTTQYIYPAGGRWVHARVLPASYGRYDINAGERVFIRDYRGYRPYDYFSEHRVIYPKNHSGNKGKNYWSYNEHSSKGKQYKSQAKSYRNDNGNRGNGAGNGKGKGNGNSRGKGGGRGNGK